MAKFILFALTFFTLSAVANGQSNQVLLSDSGYAQVNTTKLYWESLGSGVTIVFIHGSFGDRRFWDAQFEELSKRNRVLRYDVRGYGKSTLPQPDEIYTDADDLKALLDFLGIEKAHICGLSLGSIVAIDFALAYPGKCISLITCGPRVAGDESGEYRTRHHDTVSAVIQQTTAILREKGVQMATDYLWAGQHVMGKSIVSATTRTAMIQMGCEYSWWRYLHASKRKLIFPSAIKDLHTIAIPTLVVTAEYDLELCKHVAGIIAKEIPRSTLISIKNAGHMMNMDNPAQFNESILKFIGNLSEANDKKINSP